MVSTIAAFGIRGDVTAELVDERGKIVRRWQMRNSTADNLKTAIAKALAGQATGTPSYVAANIAGALTEISRVPVNSKSNPQSNVARLFASFQNADAVGTLGQLVLWDASSGGNTCAITTCNIVKPNNQVLNVYWNITLL